MATVLGVFNRKVDNHPSSAQLVPQAIDSRCYLDGGGRDNIRQTEIITVSLEGDDMPPKVDKIAEINKRIDALRDEVQSISKPELWYLRLYNLVINHKGTALGLSIILCCIGIYGKYWLDHRDDHFNSAVDGRIALVLKSPGGVLETLSEVQKTTNETNTTLKALQPFIHDVINHQFENASKLSSGAFGERLPAIKNLLAAASEQNVKTEPAIIKSLSEKLLKVDANSYGYWPTAAEFLSYRSRTLTPDMQSLLHSDLPNCTGHDPEHNMVVGSTTPHTLVIAPAEYMNCRLVLDSAESKSKINAILQSQFFLRFTNCVIVYNGGALELASSWNSEEKSIILSDRNDRGEKPRITQAKLQGPALQFDSCLFLFSVHDILPPSGEYLTRTLLAQDSSSSIYVLPKG